MKISKKILAIALAVIMVLSVLPFSAFATEYEAGSLIDGPSLQTGDKISLEDTDIHSLMGGAVLKAGQFLEFSSYEACEDWNKANGTVTSSDIYLSDSNFDIHQYYFNYVEDGASGKCYVPIDENGNVIEYILVLAKTDDDFAPITFGTYFTYTVTWKNADGTVLETDTDVAEGTVPTYDKATPTKADDAQYTYTFAGWSPEVTAVTGNVTYTAVYSQSVRQYTVTWKNYDDSVIGTSTVNAGQTPEFSDSIGQIKAKPADENHSYEFTGWTPEIVAAEADAEYTATFVDVLSISNVDEWNSFATSVKDGNTYSGKIVRMTADVGPVTTMVAGTFSGTFDGGSHTLTVNISGGNASVATFEVVKDATIQNLTLAGSITSSGIHSAALVKSLSGSGTSCTIKNVDIYADVNCSNNYLGGFIGHGGTANTVNIENSIFAGSINKTGSGQGGYIGGFIGWSQQLTATIDNCAFTGSYSNIQSFNNIGFSYNAPTKITVNDFYSNVSEVFGTSANHGTRLYTPSSSYPTTVALVNHGGEKTFFHQLSDALNAWVDGSTLMLMSDVTTANTISVGGNKTLDLNGYKLRISKNAQVISLQEGGDLTIKSSAQGGEVIGCNADRAVVGGKGQTLTLESGTIKTAASNCISGTNAVFNLNGGAIECTSNSSDMTVASAVYCKGNCTVNWNGTSITTNTGCGFYSQTATNTVKIGGGSFAATADTLPDNAGYALSNYNVEIQGAPVLNGKGIYLSNGRVINVTGELTNDVPIGVVMQTPGVFTSGLQGNGGIANFAYGNGDDYGIGLDASGEAQLVRKYTVTWKLDETTVLDTDKVLEGTVPTFTGTAPADYSDTYYTYSFSGWTPAPVAATEDATYTAAFTATAKTFTVFVKTLTGKTIFVYDVTGETTAAQIKDMLVQETGLPAAQQRLIFAGTEMANDKTLADYNIQKESTIRCVPVNYTVTWLNYDGSELASEPVGYGATPEYTGETPTKPDDAQYTYTFAGWTPEVTAVTGDVTYTATYTATELDVLPTVTAVDSTAQGYDTAYEYTYANDGSAKYANYYGDITVSFDRAIEADDVVLAGAYDNFQSGAWTPVTLRNLAAGEEFRIVKDGLVGSAVTFAKLIAITGGDFRCAAKGIDVAGVTMTVKFNLYATKTSTEPIEIASGTKTFTFPEANNGANLTLKGDIEEAIYLDADAYDLGENAVAKVTYNKSSNVSETPEVVTQTYAVNDLTPYVDPEGTYTGTYKFAFKNAPAQITEDVTVALYADENAQEPVKTITYSVKDYCDKVIATSNDAKLVALCKSILDYGAAAQTAFDYNTENMAVDEFYNANAIANLDSYDIENPVFNGTGIKAGSFACFATTDINLYVAYHYIEADGEVEVIGADDSEVKAVTKTRELSKFINISGIEAGNLLKTVIVSTTAGDIEINSQFLVKTILAYSNNATEVTLAKTIYFYAQAADAYFN